MIMEGATVNKGPMADAHLVADSEGGFLVGTMEDGPILNVYPVAYANGMDITSHYGLKPYATGIPHFHVADDGGIFCHKTILAKTG
jgi:hypothetical protein